ncbi:alpha/beta hydrolase-fold protein [Enhygromyxa salina]|nr:alpha/beta hydrolase-fold protein [Enhygromyxa salina]
MDRSYFALSLPVALCLLASGCADDAGVGGDETDGTSATGESSGDGDGDTGDGDGDGDPGDGDGDSGDGDGDGDTGDGDGDTGDGDGDTGDGDGDTGDGDGDGDGPMLPLCGTPPPDGAELAPPLPTYGGTCPVFESGMENVISTGGGDRTFIFVAPSDLQDDEVLPVMFMFHWLGASANSFYNKAEVQDAVDHYRFLAVIPDGRDINQLVPFKWPFAVTDLDFLMNEDFEMFDDLLACTAEQYNVDKECVSAMGVSAGAMFTSMLASRHGDNLSSFLSLSGGVGGLVKPWQAGGNIMPAMVLWGGRDDFCIAIDFAVGSVDLESELEGEGHPVLECIHNCTHATPPFEPPPDQPDLPIFAPAWEFMYAHPYWLEDGYSPYQDFAELPSPWPDWCAMGAGNASERVGACGGSECQ